MRTLLFLSSMLVFGCSAPAPTELLGANSTSKPDTAARRDAGTTSPVVVEDGDTSSTPVPSTSVNVWQGHVATTSAVDFGGGIYCSYRVVLTNIDVTITLDPTGHVTSSRIHSTMTESTPSCPAAPLGVQENAYAFDASKTTPPALLQASLAPAPTNLPLANVAVVAELVDAQNVRASLVFQRTGGTDPSLDWNVTTEVALTRP